MKHLFPIFAGLYFFCVVNLVGQTPEPEDGLWEGVITYKVINLSLNQKFNFTSKLKAIYHSSNFQGGLLVSSPPAYFQSQSWINLRPNGGRPVSDLFPSDGYGPNDLFDFFYNVQDASLSTYEVKSFKFAQNANGRMTAFSNAVVAQIFWSFGVKGEVIEDVSITWKWKSSLRWTPPNPE